MFTHTFSYVSENAPPSIFSFKNTFIWLEPFVRILIFSNSASHNSLINRRHNPIAFSSLLLFILFQNSELSGRDSNPELLPNLTKELHGHGHFRQCVFLLLKKCQMKNKEPSTNGCLSFEDALVQFSSKLRFCDRQLRGTGFKSYCLFRLSWSNP